MTIRSLKRPLSFLMVLAMLVSLLAVPSMAASAPEAGQDEIVLTGPITTETKTVTVTVTGCDAFQGGYLILTTGPASNTDDADSRTQIASVPFTGAGTYDVAFRETAVLTEGETVLVHLYKYDSAADRTAYQYGNAVAITTAVPAPNPEVQPGTTPEEILANCAVVLMKDSKERTETFREDETSVDVKVQLDPGVEQCYLTIFSYASNTAFDPDASHNIRLGSQFVKNGDEVTIQFTPANLPLKAGYSVIACLNVPVGPDWYRPVTSSPLKIVDESGQGFEDYDPYPNAFINETSLEAGATSMHISLEADARLFEAAKADKTSLNVAVRQYPADSNFDFEAEDQFTLYNAFDVTEPMVNQEITLTEPLKAGYRVRAVVYWEQSVELNLVKGNDYEAVFHRPDDSVLISGETVKPEPAAPTAAITGAVTPSSKQIVVTTTGEIPAGSRLLVKAYGSDAPVVLNQGTLVGADDAAASVTLTPAVGSLKSGEKLVAFVLNAGNLVAQSAPVTVGEDVPADQDSVVLAGPITTETKSASVTVSGCEAFQGGRLILTTGPVDQKEADNRTQIANLAFSGAGVYEVAFYENAVLTEGETVLVHLYKYDSAADRTAYQYGNAVAITKAGGEIQPPVQLATAIQGQVTTTSKSITIQTVGEIPADSRLIVKAYGSDAAVELSKGTLVGADDAAASVTLTPAAGSLKSGEKLVAFLVNTGEILAQSQAVTVMGEVTPPVARATVTLTDEIVTKGDTKVNASASWDESLGNQARYTLYQFTGEMLDQTAATKLSEGTVYRSNPRMIMNVRDQLVVGSKLQAVLTVGGQEILSNILVVQPSPDWGTPTVALDVAAVASDAVSIPVHVQYDQRYLTMGDEFYCDITLYQYAATITDEEFVQNEWWENSNVATRIGQINSRLGDETLGHVTVPVLEGVTLTPGSRIMAKLRLPHTEWEGEEVDYVSLSVPVVESGAAQLTERVALLNLGEETTHGQQVRAILKELGIEAYTILNQDLDEKVGYVAGLPGYEETPGEYTDMEYSVEFMLMCNLSETRLDEFLAAMQEADLFIGHKAMITEANKDWAMYELVEIITEEHMEVTRASLKELVQKVEALSETQYGEKPHWDALQQKLAEAKALLNNENAEIGQLETVRKELNDLYNTVLQEKVPEAQLEPIQAQFVKKSWLGKRTTTLTVEPDGSIQAPNANGFLQKGNAWKSEDGSLYVASNSTVTYAQLLEVLGGTAEKGAFVRFVVTREQEKPQPQPDPQPNPETQTVVISFQEDGVEVTTAQVEIPADRSFITSAQVHPYMPKGYDFAQQHQDYAVVSGVAVVPVVALGEPGPIEPVANPITVTFKLNGWGQHLEGTRGRTLTVTLNPSQSVTAPFASRTFGRAKTVNWTCDLGYQIASGNQVHYETLAQLMGGTVPENASVTFTGSVGSVW